MNACPVCGSLELKPGGLLRCAACGLAFRAAPAPAPAAYAPGLEEGIYGRAKADLFSDALDRLGRALPGRGRLLDVGCATGELMKAAAARGWRPEGVELAPALADKAAALGFTVHRRPVEAAVLDQGAYAAVTVFEVFSQMERPAEAAAEICRLMRPGGMICIREFNAGFHLALLRMEASGLFRALGASPYVLHDFNFRARTLRAMLRRAGFRDIRVRNSRPTAGDPYRSGGRLGGMVTAGLKVLYYYLAQAVWLASFGRLFIGPSLMVTARK